MDYKALGKRIRQRRKTLLLTQEQLSEKSAVSLSFIGLLERGDRKASLDTLVDLANALEISTDLLLQDSLNPGILSVSDDYKAQRKLISEMRKLLDMEYGDEEAEV